MGFAGALMCSFGWGIEAVVLAKCMQDPDVKDEYALQIRQTTSAIVNGVIILPIVKGWKFTVELFVTRESGVLILTIAIAALFATISYLFYYKAISQIGASKAMALNVSYSAWAIVFTVIFLRDTSVLTPSTIFCAIVVLVCGILAAADFKELLSRPAKSENKVSR
jgi:drug/metabolite transporter (DMT)-like permease